MKCPKGCLCYSKRKKRPSFSSHTKRRNGLAFHLGLKLTIAFQMLTRSLSPWRTFKFSFLVNGEKWKLIEFDLEFFFSNTLFKRWNIGMKKCGLHGFRQLQRYRKRIKVSIISKSQSYKNIIRRKFNTWTIL